MKLGYRPNPIIVVAATEIQVYRNVIVSDKPSHEFQNIPRKMKFSQNEDVLQTVSGQ